MSLHFFIFKNGDQELPEHACNRHSWGAERSQRMQCVSRCHNEKHVTQLFDIRTQVQRAGDCIVMSQCIFHHLFINTMCPEDL